MTCAEARKILYDIETTTGEPTLAEPGSMIALAKAHVMVCVACSEYFERERAFIASIHDRLAAPSAPVPQAVLAAVLETTSRARLQEFDTLSVPRTQRLLRWLKRTFMRS